MKNIFEHIGKVPKEIWIDNISTAVAQTKKENEQIDFQSMTYHGFKSKFCNPANGDEKGYVENKVGYTRRNLFVPVPTFDSLNDFNKELLIKYEQDSNRDYYKKIRILMTFSKQIYQK